MDTANILARAADPAVAGRRIAPYVHMLQAKDAIVTFVEDGLQRQVRPSARASWTGRRCCRRWENTAPT